MISDQGGDEGRLSTYHLNRFGAEGVKFSPTPIPRNRCLCTYKAPRWKRERKHPPLRQCQECFSNVEASFSGLELGRLVETETHGASQRESQRGWASELFKSPSTFHAKNNFFQGGYRGKAGQPHPEFLASKAPQGSH